MKFIAMNKIRTLILIVVCSIAFNANAAAGNIFIFVSFSMPNESIKGWLNQAELVGAPLVIRGLVNNSFKETIQKVSQLTKDNRGGLQLDPTLFQRFHIDKVPAVVVTNTTNCLPLQTCKEDYDVIFGDVTLSYALKKISERSDSLSPIAEMALNKLRDNHAV